MIPTYHRAGTRGITCLQLSREAVECPGINPWDPYQEQGWYQEGSPTSSFLEKMWNVLESLEVSKNDPYLPQGWYRAASPTSSFPKKLWNVLESLGSLPTAGLVPRGITHLQLSQEDVECPGIPGDIQK
ncbi:hypothetical protein DUI87_04791 [Hirundo rustica rustica]|uniref:Uncharacterized protein n=1 Tax=Hirundo rustica rustica TaxID=333673 RepID=A0A3M0L4S1_HIRRU|nr:hypothetical protein DUI87_04791 [Hirundo rustica rustica]